MSVSSLDNPAIGHKFGLAYLSDVVVAGGVTSITVDTDELSGAVVLESSDSSVSITVDGQNIDLSVAGGGGGVASIGYDNGGTPALLTGAITLASGDSSVQISSGILANQINLQVPIPVIPDLIVLNQINIPAGVTTGTFPLTSANNFQYFYITKSTDVEAELYVVNFTTAEILPEGFTIFVKNSIPFETLTAPNTNDVEITQNGNPVSDIGGTDGVVHCRGTATSINTAFVCLSVLTEGGVLSML